jgi:hypothetical protein
MAHEQSFRTFHHDVNHLYSRNKRFQSESSGKITTWLENQGPVIKIWLLVMLFNLTAILFL